MKNLCISLLLINTFSACQSQTCTWLLRASLCPHLSPPVLPCDPSEGWLRRPSPPLYRLVSKPLLHTTVIHFFVHLFSYWLLVALRIEALLAHCCTKSSCYHDWRGGGARHPAGDWSTLSWFVEVCIYECELQSECLRNCASQPTPHPSTQAS